MSARRPAWATAAAVAAGLACLAALPQAAALGQFGQSQVSVTTTGPLKYAINPRGGALPGGTVSLGGGADLEPVVELEPGTPSAGFDVTLLDLPRPKGAMAAVQEGAPLVLTPARLADLRRRHATALKGGFNEQAWDELLADMIGRPEAKRGHGKPPRASQGKSGKSRGSLFDAIVGGTSLAPRSRAPRWSLPQSRLVWEILKQASAPRVFLDFDNSNRARVWGALAGTPTVSPTGVQAPPTPADSALLDASSGVQGLVLVKNDNGDLTAPEFAAEVVIIAGTGNSRKTFSVKTDATGYFCWPLPAGLGVGNVEVGVPGAGQPAEVTVEQGSWSNVVIVSAGPLAGMGTKGMGRGEEGARDAVNVMSALSGLLAGTAVSNIVPALSSTGLPLQTGAMWSPHRSIRAYYGVERALAPATYDRSLRPLGPANLVIEFWKYPLRAEGGRGRPGAVERLYVQLAKQYAAAAQQRFQRAKSEADSSNAELERLSKIVQATDPATNAASYKDLIESQIELRREYGDRRSEAESTGAVYQVQQDFVDLTNARLLKALRPRSSEAEGLWKALRDGYNRDGALPEGPDRADVDVLNARIVQKLNDDTARAGKLGVAGQIDDPTAEHIAYEGAARREQDEGYIRFIRVRLIAVGIPTDDVTIANRLRPGDWGISAGMVAGGEGSQAAVAGWWLWDRLGLRLTAGSTFANGDLPGQLMLGVGVQVPIGGSGGGSSGGRSKPASHAAASSGGGSPSTASATEHSHKSGTSGSDGS